MKWKGRKKQFFEATKTFLSVHSAYSSIVSKLCAFYCITDMFSRKLCLEHLNRKCQVATIVGKSVNCLILIQETHCGNYGNLLSNFSGKNFVKPTFLLKKSLKSWFDEIFFLWERISRFSTLWVSAQCGKMKNLVSLKKYFVKSTL